MKSMERKLRLTAVISLVIAVAAAALSAVFLANALSGYGKESFSLEDIGMSSVCERPDKAVIGGFACAEAHNVKRLAVVKARLGNLQFVKASGKKGGRCLTVYGGGSCVEFYRSGSDYYLMADGRDYRVITAASVRALTEYLSECAASGRDYR